MNRFTLFTSAPKTSIGVDIGTDTIKFVKLRRKGKRYMLVSYGIIPNSQPKEVSSQEKSDAVAEVLKTVFKNEKNKTPIFTCVSGPDVIIKNFNLADMPGKQLDSTVFWASKRFLSIPLEEMSYDYKITGKVIEKTLKKNSVLFVAAPTKNIADILELFQKVNLKVEKITTIPFALFNYMQYVNNAPSNYVIIDIGSSYTTIAIFHKNVLEFSREIVTAGNSITEAISDSTSVEVEKADMMKRKFGLTENGEQPGVVDAIKPVVERLIKEIDRSISFYQQKNQNFSVEKFYLVGGTSIMPGFIQLMKASLGKEVEIINPLEKIDISSSLKDSAKLSEVSPLLTEAIGLALERGDSVDLLPHKIKREKVIKQMAQFFSVTAICLAVTLAVLSSLVNIRYNNSAKLLDVWKTTTNNTINQSGMSIDQIRTENNRYEKMNKFVHQVENRVISDPLLPIKEVASFLPAPVVVEKISVVYPEKKDSQEGAEKKVASTLPFSIQGVVYGDEVQLEIDLFNFFKALNDSPFFKNSKLVSQERSNTAGRSFLRFTITTELK